VETISIIVLLCHYKHNSRRSISKAAPCFGNLCVHEPSALRRKPSNLCCSCATNAFQKNVLNVGVLFLACIVSSSYSSIVFTDLCKEQLQDTIKLDFRNFFKLLTNLPFRSPLIESFHPCSMLFVFTFFCSQAFKILRSSMGGALQLQVWVELGQGALFPSQAEVP